MTVNLNQYLRTVRDFNNRKNSVEENTWPIPTKKYFDNSPNPNNNDPNCSYSKKCNLP